MRNNDILNFIAPCLNGELSEALSGGEILRITFDDGALSLSASVKFDRLIADRLILDAQKAVREYFGIRKVTLSPVYTGLELSQDCAPMLIRAVKENIAAANGFLDSAKFGFADRVGFSDRPRRRSVAYRRQNPRIPREIYLRDI